MRWLAALFGWRSVFCTGVWDYQQNRVTGARRAVRVNAGGHQPLDRGWLKGEAGIDASASSCGPNK